MTATAEKPPVTTEMFEAWMASWKAMNWTQDQMEKLAGSWMEQAHTMRHDGEKVLEVLVSQAKTNTEEMQQLAEHGVKSALQFVPGWDVLTQADLRRQVADLQKRVDELSHR